MNEAVDALDAGMTEMLTIEVDDTNACFLTNDAVRQNFFIVVTEGSPAPTAAIAVQVPAIRRGLFKLLNLTQQTVAIEVPGQSGNPPQIGPGENRMLSCDGSDVRAAGIGDPGSRQRLDRRTARCGHLGHRHQHGCDDRRGARLQQHEHQEQARTRSRIDQPSQNFFDGA